MTAVPAAALLNSAPLAVQSCIKTAASGSFCVQRVAHGLYWRCYPEGHPYHGQQLTVRTSLFCTQDRAQVAAANLLCSGWAHQALRHSFYVVLGKRLKPPLPRMNDLRRRNPCHAEMTWLEVSALEALSTLDFVECR